MEVIDDWVDQRPHHHPLRATRQNWVRLNRLPRLMYASGGQARGWLTGLGRSKRAKPNAYQYILIICWKGRETGRGSRHCPKKARYVPLSGCSSLCGKAAFGEAREDFECSKNRAQKKTTGRISVNKKWCAMPESNPQVARKEGHGDDIRRVRLITTNEQQRGSVGRVNAQVIAVVTFAALAAIFSQ